MRTIVILAALLVSTTALAQSAPPPMVDSRTSHTRCESSSPQRPGMFGTTEIVPPRRTASTAKWSAASRSTPADRTRESAAALAAVSLFSVLSDAQLVFLKALSQRQVAERAVERAQMLVKADVIGTAELQKREADLAQATAELDVARDELELLGMPKEAIDKVEATRTINSVARIVASMSGTVLERKLTVGQVVQPADTAFEVEIGRVHV